MPTFVCVILYTSYLRMEPKTKIKITYTKINRTRKFHTVKAYLSIHEGHIPEMNLNKVNSTLINICTYPFNELCTIIFSLQSFYTATYITTITCPSFGRHGCMEKENMGNFVRCC